MTRLILAFSVPATLAAWQVPGTAFQNVFTAGNGEARAVTVRSAGGKPVTGRPVSASEERHSLQVLADGTRIETRTVDKYYRDDQGRTRTERADGSVIVEDPVSGVRAEIAANGKLVRSSRYSVVGNNVEIQADALTFQLSRAVTVPGEMTGAIAPKTIAAGEMRKDEPLGVQSVNGVLTDATRTVTTIPTGQIGNDRPIEIVAERWYSSDLQMLVRSVNKDPRFGETSYELTNIHQGAPDPSLFRIPAGSRQ